MSKPVNPMRPVHPVEALREQDLAPLALALCVPATRIHEIVRERDGVSADTAERLVRYFGGDAASWLAMQTDYELETLPHRAETPSKLVPIGCPAV